LVGNEHFDGEENYKKDGNDQILIADLNACRTIYVSTNIFVNFSSPNEIPNTSCRLSNSASENSKETPKDDVTSSSSLLRAAHSEGGSTIGKSSSAAHDDIGL